MTVSQQVVELTESGLPSQKQPAGLGSGFSASSLTKRSSIFLTLQSGFAHTSSYWRTLRPGNRERSSLSPNVPVGQTLLVSTCRSSTTTAPPGRRARVTFGAIAFVGSYVRTIRSHASSPNSNASKVLTSARIRTPIRVASAFAWRTPSSAESNPVTSHPSRARKSELRPCPIPTSNARPGLRLRTASARNALG